MSNSIELDRVSGAGGAVSDAEVYVRPVATPEVVAPQADRFVAVPIVSFHSVEAGRVRPLDGRSRAAKRIEIPDPVIDPQNPPLQPTYLELRAILKNPGAFTVLMNRLSADWPLGEKRLLTANHPLVEGRPLTGLTLQDSSQWDQVKSSRCFKLEIEKTPAGLAIRRFDHRGSLELFLSWLEGVAGRRLHAAEKQIMAGFWNYKVPNGAFQVTPDEWNQWLGDSQKDPASKILELLALSQPGFEWPSTLTLTGRIEKDEEEKLKVTALGVIIGSGPVPASYFHLHFRQEGSRYHLNDYHGNDSWQSARRLPQELITPEAAAKIAADFLDTRHDSHTRAKQAPPKISLPDDFDIADDVRRLLGVPAFSELGPVLRDPDKTQQWLRAKAYEQGLTLPPLNDAFLVSIQATVVKEPYRDFEQVQGARLVLGKVNEEHLPKTDGLVLEFRASQGKIYLCTTWGKGGEEASWGRGGRQLFLDIHHDKIGNDPQAKIWLIHVLASALGKPTHLGRQEVLIPGEQFQQVKKGDGGPVSVVTLENVVLAHRPGLHRDFIRLEGDQCRNGTGRFYTSLRLVDVVPTTPPIYSDSSRQRLHGNPTYHQFKTIIHDPKLFQSWMQGFFDRDIGGVWEEGATYVLTGFDPSGAGDSKPLSGLRLLKIEDANIKGHNFGLHVTRRDGGFVISKIEGPSSSFDLALSWYEGFIGRVTHVVERVFLHWVWQSKTADPRLRSQVLDWCSYFAREKINPVSMVREMATALAADRFPASDRLILRLTFNRKEGVEYIGSTYFFTEPVPEFKGPDMMDFVFMTDKTGAPRLAQAAGHHSHFIAMALKSWATSKMAAKIKAYPQDGRLRLSALWPVIRALFDALKKPGNLLHKPRRQEAGKKPKPDRSEEIAAKKQKDAEAKAAKARAQEEAKAAGQASKAQKKAAKEAAKAAAKAAKTRAQEETKAAKAEAIRKAAEAKAVEQANKAQKKAADEVAKAEAKAAKVHAQEEVKAAKVEAIRKAAEAKAAEQANKAQKKAAEEATKAEAKATKARVQDEIKAAQKEKKQRQAAETKAAKEKAEQEARLSRLQKAREARLAAQAQEAQRAHEEALRRQQEREQKVGLADQMQAALYARRKAEVEAARAAVGNGFVVKVDVAQLKKSGLMWDNLHFFLRQVSEEAQKRDLAQRAGHVALSHLQVIHHFIDEMKKLDRAARLESAKGLLIPLKALSRDHVMGDMGKFKAEKALDCLASMGFELVLASEVEPAQTVSPPKPKGKPSAPKWGWGSLPHSNVLAAQPVTGKNSSTVARASSLTPAIKIKASAPAFVITGNKPATRFPTHGMMTSPVWRPAGFARHPLLNPGFRWR